VSGNGLLKKGECMDNFCFPSDQDRAESPELDRVCIQLESMLEVSCESAAEKLAKGITDAAVKAGGVEPGLELTGPQLLMVVNDMAEALVGLLANSTQMSQADIHKVAKRYLSKRQQGYFMEEVREALSGSMTQAFLEQLAKHYLLESQLSRFNREIRDLVPASKVEDDRGDCCCGETEQAWRLCPLHKEVTSTETVEG
jgi:hypothetical protein